MFTAMRLPYEDDCNLVIAIGYWSFENVENASAYKIVADFFLSSVAVNAMSKMQQQRSVASWLFSEVLQIDWERPGILE